VTVFVIAKTTKTGQESINWKAGDNASVQG